MRRETLERLKLALDSNISLPVKEYLEERLSNLQNDLVSCGTDDIFRQTQGRALEVQELLKIVRNVRENR